LINLSQLLRKPTCHKAELIRENSRGIQSIESDKEIAQSAKPSPSMTNLHSKFKIELKTYSTVSKKPPAKRKAVATPKGLGKVAGLISPKTNLKRIDSKDLIHAEEHIP
jgi:hypothetical protein